jgi:hypothetical protein
MMRSSEQRFEHVFACGLRGLLNSVPHHSHVFIVFSLVCGSPTPRGDVGLPNRRGSILRLSTTSSACAWQHASGCCAARSRLRCMAHETGRCSGCRSGRVTGASACRVESIGCSSRTRVQRRTLRLELRRVPIVGALVGARVRTCSHVYRYVHPPGVEPVVDLVPDLGASSVGVESSAGWDAGVCCHEASDGCFDLFGVG